MSENLTEEQQVEAIKNWWKENGISVVLGLLIGFGALFGWNYWKDLRDDNAAQASVVYQQLLSDIQAKKLDDAKLNSQKLLTEFEGTPYATLAAFSLARMAVEAGDMNTAKAQLQWVLDNSRQEQFLHTARLRLARVLISNNEVDVAAAVISNIKVDAYASPYAELRGDIALARGDRDTARNEYTIALESASDDNQQRSAIQGKLDDVAAVESK